MISGAAFRGGPFSYLMHPMLIRPEMPVDIDAIRDLTAAAFAPMPYSDGTEPEIIDRLRADGRVIRVLRPVRESLEDLFMRYVQDPETGKAKAPGAIRKVRTSKGGDA